MNFLVPLGINYRKIFRGSLVQLYKLRVHGSEISNKTVYFGIIGVLK